MTEYKLESYLNALCMEHPQYEDLQATWTLNKRTCSDILKGILIQYPHFSMHDASHAEAVIAKMEMILGERIFRLSPTDVWLLLHTAYAHDLGMVILWEEITKLWNQPEFQDFLNALDLSLDSELREAAEFVKKKSNDVTNISAWPLTAYRCVNLINAAYFRGQHAEMSQKYVQTPKMNLGLDLGHNGLIQPRLIKLLGEICELHMEPSKKILSLDYQTNGFGSDYVHPRFIAVLLRLGDLLDVDNGRFNTTVEFSIGGLPKSSIVHKEKHEAKTHLLVTPRKIEFRSDCPDLQAYLEARNFIKQLEDELNFFTKYWSEIVPEGFDGYVPCLQKKDLLLCGTPDIEGIADLKFEISQEKAFQIIEGSNIYKDKFIFIRELLQNAADASKLQLWEDLTSGIYQAWIGHNKEIAALQPYEIDEKIYQNYPIDIKLATQENNLTEVEVSDCGTGISIETFKLMCRVGTSNSGSKRIQNDIRSMPNWLRPTAGFGVGLQSIFLLTESFEIDTNTGKETFHAVVQSNRSGGYLQLQRTELSRPRGTTIRFRFRMPRQFQYSMMGETQSYLGLHFDPLSSQDHLGEVRVIEAIHNNCGSSLFPVNVSCTEEHIEHLKLLNMLPVSGIQAETWRNYNNRYRIDISHPEKMILIWDSQTASYGEIRFVRRGYRRFCFRFKGNDVEKDTPYLRASGISVLLDVYGLNTRETITLDRSGLTQEGVKAVAEIWNDMFPACIDCLLEEIAAKKNLWNQLASGEDEFSAYTIWLLCSPDQREKMPLELLSKMQDHAVVLIKEENGYVKKTKPVNDLISTMEKNRYVNVESFDTHIGENPVNYAQICEIMNCGEPSNAEIVIADSTFQNSMDAMWLKALQMPVTDEQLWIYSISHQQTLIKADEKTQKILLKGLSEHIPGMNYSFSYRSYKAKRYAIPALTKYRDLAVNDLPYGFAVPHGHYRCSYVIAPFTREEIKKLDGMSKDAFCEWNLSLPIFQRLVDFIKEHSIRSENIPNEQIVEQYKILIHDYYSATDNSPNSVTEVT